MDTIVSSMNKKHAAIRERLEVDDDCLGEGSTVMPLAKADPVFNALTYEAPFLIEKLLKEQIVETPEEARILFTEVKRYIILVFLDKMTLWEMYSLRIDEAWHQFVLFTREYVDFSVKYFGTYIHHSPGNSPGSGAVHGAMGTWEGFKKRYEEFYGIPLPHVWQDENGITVRRRILNHNVGKLSLRDGHEMIDLMNATGRVLLSVNALAREALTFICQTGAFYVRELPGDLVDEEKIALVSTLVKHKVLRVGS